MNKFTKALVGIAAMTALAFGGLATPVLSSSAEAAQPIASQCPSNYQVGAKNNVTCVKLIQAGLNTLKYTDNSGAKLAVDGDYGTKTKQAIIKFQKAKGLSQDGIAGPKTIAALDKALVNKPTTYTPYKPGNVVSSGSGWTLKNGADYSSVQCASGSTLMKNTTLNRGGKTDANGIYKNYNGTKLRVCYVNLDPKHTPIASVISQNAVALFQAAKNANYPLSMTSGLRSYQNQQYLYSCYIHKNCNNGNTAAKPGTSNHENGIAMDLATAKGGSIKGTATFTWLKNNAPKYGFYNLPSEAWHWSASGK